MYEKVNSTLVKLIELLNKDVSKNIAKEDLYICEANADKMIKYFH